jgi:hypothetical protein
MATLRSLLGATFTWVIAAIIGEQHVGAGEAMSGKRFGNSNSAPTAPDISRAVVALGLVGDAIKLQAALPT